MKTSLNIQDSLYAAAKKEAGATGSTVSEIISRWAWAGRQALSRKSERKKTLKTVDLGGAARVDLTARRDWLDLLDSEGR